MSDEAQRREQIESDAAFALRLQEEELRQASYMLPSPSRLAFGGGGGGSGGVDQRRNLPDRRPAPYFFGAGAGSGAGSARRSADRHSARSAGGVPDRQRMPYSYVNNPESQPAQAPHPPQPHFQHHTHVEFGTRSGGAGAGASGHMADLMENFGMFFPQPGGGNPGGGVGFNQGGGGRRLGGDGGERGGGAGVGPEHMTGAMADMLRMFEHFESGTFPGFVHGGPPPPRGGTTFFMGTTGGAVPHVPGMDAMPPFFRQFFDQAPHATYEEFLDMIERRGNVNRGANDDELDKLKQMKWKDFKRKRPKQGTAASSSAGRVAGVDEKEKCVICLGEFENDDDVTVLPCEHVFCASCINQWLKVNRTCPSCKRSIREGEEDYQH